MTFLSTALSSVLATTSAGVPFHAHVAKITNINSSAGRSVNAHIWITHPSRIILASIKKRNENGGQACYQYNNGVCVLVGSNLFLLVGSHSVSYARTQQSKSRPTKNAKVPTKTQDKVNDISITIA